MDAVYQAAITINPILVGILYGWVVDRIIQQSRYWLWGGILGLLIPSIFNTFSVIVWGIVWGGDPDNYFWTVFQVGIFFLAIILSSILIGVLSFRRFSSFLVSFLAGIITLVVIPILYIGLTYILENYGAGDRVAMTNFGIALLGVNLFIGYEQLIKKRQVDPPSIQSRVSSQIQETNTIKEQGSRAKSTQTRKIFISYRRADNSHATDRIYEKLTEYFGKESVFLDIDTIPLGADFRDYLDKQLAECTALLVVMGQQWLNITDENGQRRLENPNDFVRLEIEIALGRNIPTIPVLIDEARIPYAHELPNSLESLSRRQGISIGRGSNFHAEMDRLIRALEQIN